MKVNKESQSFPNNITITAKTISSILGFFLLLLSIYEKQSSISSFFHFTGRYGLAMLDAFLPINIFFILFMAQEAWEGRRKIKKVDTDTYLILLSLSFLFSIGCLPYREVDQYVPSILLVWAGTIHQPIYWGNLAWLACILFIIYIFWYYSEQGKQARRNNFYSQIVSDDERRNQPLYQKKLNEFINFQEELNDKYDIPSRKLLPQREIRLVTSIPARRYSGNIHDRREKNIQNEINFISSLKGRGSFDLETYQDIDFYFLAYWDEVLAGEHLESTR